MTILIPSAQLFSDYLCKTNLGLMGFGALTIGCTA